MPLTPETSNSQKHPVEIFRPRFSRFLKTVLEPAVHGCSSPLRVAAWQTPEIVPFGHAIEQLFTAITPGFRWGPAWSTCWFRLTGAVPADARPGVPLDLRFSTRTEATLWLDLGDTPTPVRGFDINRDTVDLTRYLDLAPGDSLTVFIEAACNHPFGTSTFDWDTSDTRDRWRSEDPGHFLYAEVAARREPVRRLAGIYRFASLLLDELDPASPEAGSLFDALTERPV
jgi:alpha-mannosidase